MGVLGQYGPNALKYWGSILASAAQGASVADMWQAIRDQQQTYGLERPGASAPDVMVLRGYANRLVNAQNALAAARPSDLITADMTSVAPWSGQTLQGLAATPAFDVTAMVTVQAPDGTETTRPLTYLDAPNPYQATAGDYADQVTSYFADIAEAATGEGGTPHGTVTAVSGVSIRVR